MDVSSHGYSFLELTFVLGMMATLGSVAIPQTLVALDDLRTVGAARHIAARLQRARMDAVTRSADVGLQVTQTTGGYSYATYVDGNRNSPSAPQRRTTNSRSSSLVSLCPR